MDGIFSKKLLPSVCAFYLFSNTLVVNATDNTKPFSVSHYLDPTVTEIIVDQKQCFRAAPTA